MQKKHWIVFSVSRTFLLVLGYLLVCLSRWQPAHRPDIMQTSELRWRLRCRCTLFDDGRSALVSTAASVSPPPSVSHLRVDPHLLTPWAPLLAAETWRTGSGLITVITRAVCIYSPCCIPVITCLCHISWDYLCKRKMYTRLYSSTLTKQECRSSVF